MTERSSNWIQPNPRINNWVAGGGEMGELIRSLDWSNTSLGSLTSWPQSLRSAVSILLPSKAQIAMFWGPDLITLYNDAYRPVLGKKHPGALGRPVKEVWNELWDAGLKELFEGVLQTGQAFWASDWPFYMERYGFTEETFFDISYDPIRDETGNVGGLFCIVSDTTSRVLSERRLKTLRDLSLRAAAGGKSVEEACGAVANILSSNRHDVPFTLLYLLNQEANNARLVGTSGLDPGTAVAPVSVAVSSSAGDHSCWPFNEVLLTNRPLEITDVIARCGELPDGVWPEPPHTAMVIPISGSGQESIVGFLVAGVSPRRPLDDQYRAFFDLLTTQIATTIANARAYEQERRRAEALAELDRAKTTFFSNVSHEFRTPLTLMLGPVADLLTEAEGPLPPSHRERLEIAHRNGLRLEKLVNTMLDFSRIEAGRVQCSYEPVDLTTLTADLASNFRSACEKAGLELVVDCHPLLEPIYVDPDMWEKIVLNLLSNAFKFTLSGRIEVKLKPNDSQVELAVRDTGIGIPVDELPKLFERFHRVERSRGRTQEGSGIGLALVRELVKLHGGSVSVKSNVGRGSTFTVSIPRGKNHLPPDRISAERTLASTALGAAPFVGEALRWVPEADQSALDHDPRELVYLDVETKRPRGLAGGRRFRLVLAEDNSDMRDYLRRLLSSEGHEIRTVNDGEAAWRAIQEEVPDLLLSDVMMPIVDGFELLRRVRNDARTREIPVILLSARAGEESRIEGLEASADAYLVKPFSARELLATVDAHVRMREIRREKQEALRASEERYRQLLNFMPVAVYTCASPSGEILCYNQRAVDLWGREPKLGDLDARFSNSFRLWRGDGTPLPHEQTPMAIAIREGKTFRNEELVIERPDGTRIDVLINIDPLYDAAGNIVGAINAFHDTSQLKLAQQALRQSEEHLRAVVETTPQCIKIVAADGTLLDMNQAGLDLVGADCLEELKGQSVYNLISESDRDSFRQFNERICSGERGSAEFDIVGLKAKRRRMETHAVPLRNANGNVVQLAITHDITERQKTEEMLRQSANQLRLITDITPVYIAHLDREQRYLFVNKPYAERLGLTPEECVGKLVHEVLGFEAYATFRSYIEEVLSGKHVEFELEVPYSTIGPHFMHCSYVPEFDQKGGVVGWVAAITDISQRKLVEQALRASEERYRQIFEQSIDGVFVATHDGRYVDVSPSGCEMLGLTHAEVLGKSIEDVVLPEECERIPATVAAFADGQVHYSEWRFRRKDGSVFVGEVSGRELPDGRLQGIVRDITERKQAEAALRKSERELSDFFDNAAIGLHWVGPDGIILRANRAELEMLGYSREEYVGRHIADFHVDRPTIDYILGELLRGERIYEYPAALRCKDGSIREVLITSSALFEDGRFIHTRCFTADVTARKRAEQQLAAEHEATKRLHALSIRLGSAEDQTVALQDLLDNAIASCNADFGNIQLYNSQSGALEIVAQKNFQEEFLDYFHAVRIDDGSACAQAMLNGKRIVIGDVNTDPEFAPHRGIAASTGFRAVQSTPLLTHDGQIVGMLSTHFRRPHRLSEREERLLDLYARHAADLIERLRFESALREADRRKDEFLATLAHELRNPLAPISNGLQLIRLSKDNPKALHEATTIIDRQVQQMVRLVDDLLDVARISSNKLELRKKQVSLAEIVSSAAETSRPMIESASHTLQISLPQQTVTLDADPVRLAQAFSNLLNNAAKYSQPGGRILLAAAQEKGELIVRVSDQGIGIDSDKLERIFEMFMQVDPSKERAQGGLGIGLTLVQRLVEMHGGSIEAHSEGIGKGSEFVIRLPIVATNSAAAPAPVVNDQPASTTVRRRILLVDDNVDSVESMAMMLELFGHEVRVAYDGLEAIEAAKLFQPDLAFLDLGMPRLSGYDAARQIRQQPWGQQIVLVALTGWGKEEDRRRTLEAGFNCHIVKPIDFTRLEQLVLNVGNGKDVD